MSALLAPPLPFTTDLAANWPGLFGEPSRREPRGYEHAPTFQPQQLPELHQQLVKVLTHEVMNSMTPILSLAETIEGRLTDKRQGGLAANLSEAECEDLLRCLSSIQSRSTGLLRFVQAYSRLTELPLPQFQNLDLDRVLEQAYCLIAPTLHKANIRWEQAQTNLRVRADAQQVEQVLLNLVQNAIEALADQNGGRIHLSAREAGGGIILHIQDNGPGIPAHHLESIFLPFFTTKTQGSGIGLSLSRQIMRLNRGALEVESMQGQGATFMLALQPSGC